jgi:hypothetical protein
LGTFIIASAVNQFWLTQSFLFVLFFMWVGWFCGCHVAAVVGGCFLGLDCILASVGVWEVAFSAQDQHRAMLNPAPCECGSTYRAKKISHTPIEKSNTP